MLIVINGVDEVRRFTLPSDCSWQCDWSSATAVGLRLAPGDRLQRIGKNQALRSNWTMSVSEKDNIHQLLKTIQASLAEQDKLHCLAPPQSMPMCCSRMTSRPRALARTFRRPCSP